jgi:hypothetical protein
MLLHETATINGIKMNNEQNNYAKANCRPNISVNGEWPEIE